MARVIDGTAVPAMAETAEIQPFDDGGVIVNTQTGQLYSCNHVTMDYLSMVDGVKTIDMLAAAIAEAYSADVAEVQRDLIDISGELVGEDLLAVR
jgi:hypothetical protein